jgi:hypothetical protein
MPDSSGAVSVPLVHHTSSGPQSGNADATPARNRYIISSPPFRRALRKG